MDFEIYLLMFDEIISYDTTQKAHLTGDKRFCRFPQAGVLRQDSLRECERRHFEIFKKFELRLYRVLVFSHNAKSTPIGLLLLKKAIRDFAVSRKRESYGKIRLREYERRHFEIF